MAAEEATVAPRRRDRREYNRLYNLTHRAQLREYSRAYSSAHREHLNARRRELYHQRHREKKLKSYQLNRERVLAQKREYYQRNRSRIATYREKNKEQLSRQNSEWYHRNKEKCRPRKRRESQKRRLIPSNRIEGNLRRRINKVLSDQCAKKLDSTMNLMGCSAAEFRRYIEFQFQPGMSWDNHGVHGWHLDHVIPCSAFDLSEERQQRQCFHFTNLRPMWARENLRKANTIVDAQLCLLL